MEKIQREIIHDFFQGTLILKCSSEYMINCKAYTFSIFVMTQKNEKGYLPIYSPRAGRDGFCPFLSIVCLCYIVDLSFGNLSLTLNFLG